MDKFYVAFWALFVLGFNFANSWDNPIRKLKVIKKVDYEETYHIEDKVSYIQCEGNYKKINCTVYREKFPYEDPPYTCNITLSPEVENGRLPNYWPTYVVPFGEDKSIVVWSESTRPWCLKLLTIKMNSCNSSQAILCQHYRAFQHLQEAATIVPYNDYYDVIFKNSTMCKNSMCRITYDANSKIVNGPHAAVFQSNESIFVRENAIGHIGNAVYVKKPFSPLSADSLDKGLFYVGKSQEVNDTVYNYTIVNRDGSETSIDKIKMNQSKLVGTSSSNGIIGVCYGTNNIFFNCTQYYGNGTVKYNLTFTANEPWEHIIDMYNLPDGGFLFLAYNKKNVYKYYRHTLVKVTSDGPMYKAIEIPMIKRFYDDNRLSDPQVFMNKNREYCVSSVVYGYIIIDLYANCFTDSDFIDFNSAIPRKDTLLRKTVLMPKVKTQLMFNKVYHTEDKLAYALCTRSETEKNCTIVREKFPLQVPSFSCNITLRPQEKNGRFGSEDPIDVIPLGEDNVIIGWSESDSPLCLKLTTLKMSSCDIKKTAVVCQDKEVFPYPKVIIPNYRGVPINYYDVFPAVIVVHDNFYDVIFENRTLCPNFMCKMTFDADSKLINGPVPVVQQIELKTKKKRFSPLSTKSWGEELFYVGQSEIGNNTIYNYTVIHPNGTETSIDKVEDGRQPKIMSTVNGIVGVCNNPNDTLYNCTQYFGNGTVKHNLTFTTGQQWSDIEDMYNLPEGGFLILAQINLGDSGYGHFVYDLVKVNSDGQKFRTIEIKHQDLHYWYPRRRLDAQVFLYENKNFCVSVAIFDLDHKEKGYLDMYADCFTGSDLL